VFALTGQTGENGDHSMSKDAGSDNIRLSNLGKNANLNDIASNPHDEQESR
jgi:hypothetical protein